MPARNAGAPDHRQKKVLEEIGTSLAGVSPSASADALVSGSRARLHNRWIERLIFLPLLLAAELTLLTLPLRPEI